MTGPLEKRLRNLHEFCHQARINLNRNNWDYLFGGSETEETLARDRAALDAWGISAAGVCVVAARRSGKVPRVCRLLQRSPRASVSS